MRIGLQAHRRVLEHVVDRAAPAALLVEAAQAFAQCLVGRCLHLGVQGGVDPEALAPDDIRRISVRQRLAHPFDEIGREFRVACARFEQDRPGLGLSGRLCRNHLLRDHAFENKIAARQGRLRVKQRRVRAGVPRQPGDERALIHREILQLLAEVSIGCGRHPVSAMPEIVLVAVKRQDLLLGVSLFDLPGNEQLLHLAVERLLHVAHQQAGKLLGDGARALRAAHAADVPVDRPQQRRVIDAGMVVKLIVFGGQDCELEACGDVLESNDNAPLDGEFPDDLVVVGIQVGDDVGVEILEALDLGKVVLISGQNAGRDPDQTDKEHQNPIQDQEPPRKPVPLVRDGCR